MPHGSDAQKLNLALCYTGSSADIGRPGTCKRTYMLD